MRSELFDLHAKIELEHWWFVGRRRLVNRVIERATVPADRGVLVDVGCGTGANIAAFSGWRKRVGIDTSEEAIAAARTGFPEIDFRQGFAPEDLGDLASEVDLYTVMDVIEHVEDDFELFSKLAATTRPGAQILITVPADPSLWTQHDVSFGHYRRYTPERLQMVWQGLPMELRLMSHFNSRLFPVVKAIRTVKGDGGGTAGELETDFFIPPRPINAALTRVFAGEAGRLERGLDSPGGKLPYRHGVSLFALLRRLPGELEPRTRPDSVKLDASPAG